MLSSLSLSSSSAAAARFYKLFEAGFALLGVCPAFLW